MNEMDKIMSIKEAIKEKKSKKILSDNHKKKLATNLKSDFSLVAKSRFVKHSKT